MMRIILCEGETDLILLGLYLERTCGWKYERKPKHPLKIPKANSGGNKKSETYSKESAELIICCVGGKDNFGDFFKTYISPLLFYSDKDESDFRIALVTDADSRSVDEIKTDMLEQLSPTIHAMHNNEWTANSSLNSYEDPINIEFLLCIIPRTGSGALETVLMNSLAEMHDGETIVDESNQFIDNLPANVYLPSDRLKLKAKLGVALSVIYPDKVFSQFDNQLRIVDWSSSATLAECFEKLIEI